MSSKELLFNFVLALVIVISVMIVFALGVSVGKTPCHCPESDPVAAFILSQPDIAIDMTGVPADKTPNPWLMKKGWDLHK